MIRDPNETVLPMVISQWGVDSPTEGVIIQFIPPCGVDTNTFKFKVVDHGFYLEITYIWPRQFSDVLQLNQYRLHNSHINERIMNYHPIIKGFRDFFRNLRDKEDDHIESFMRVHLPVQVNPVIVKVSKYEGRIGFCSIEVELSAVLDDYPSKSHRVNVIDLSRPSLDHASSSGN